MRAYAILGIFAGIVSLVLGVLFTLYISLSPANLASDLIFLAAGFLLIRKGWSMRNSPAAPKKKESDEQIERGRETNPKSKNKNKYRNRRR